MLLSNISFSPAVCFLKRQTGICIILFSHLYQVVPRIFSLAQVYYNVFVEMDAPDQCGVGERTTD